MRTQVAVVGAGPAGSLLSILLRRAGIDCVVLERQSRGYVMERVRAGILEWGSVEVLREAGVGANMDRLGVVHDGVRIAWGGRSMYFDVAATTGRHLMAYGQAPLQRDLYEVMDALDIPLIDRATEVLPHDVASAAPWVSYRVADGAERRVDAEFVVGCDGHHGVCRNVIPPPLVRTFEKDYPVGWLGILSETPPLHDVLYCHHASGFALASQRNSMLSRYYVQCSATDSVADWPDERVWADLRRRLPPEFEERLVQGPSIEKSITTLHSYVAEPLRYGNLFLAGDAGHIVPPTGAKGLNLAIADVHYLAQALEAHFVRGDDSGLERYSDVALRRIWSSVRFSWWLTSLLHRFPHHTPIDQRLQEVELDHLERSARAAAAFCEQYAGMPFESLWADSGVTV
jgi:p-hydroxybenzoate 3-monooxygenase